MIGNLYVGKLANHTLLKDCKLVQLSRKTISRSIIKSKITYSLHTAVALLGLFITQIRMSIHVCSMFKGENINKLNTIRK